MKIYILFEFKDSLSGGGSQFLKAIKNVFVSKGLYVEDIKDADIILYNSHQYVAKLLKYKFMYKNKIFVHRIDGPMRLYNTLDDKRDLIVNITNKYIADATIFQSYWSRTENLKMGMQNNTFEAIIINAPDANIFNMKDKINFNQNRKIRLIATSWSDNPKKGFDIYKWLDEYLDFKRFEFTFVGNSSVGFKNIIDKKPMGSKELAIELKQNDIFITASQKDPCSNSLIEALHCGLPAIALDDGGHPEIIACGGEVFERKEDIFSILDKIESNYINYQNKINLPKIEQVAEDYHAFLENIYNEKKIGRYHTKTFRYKDYLILKSTLTIWKIKESVNNRWQKYKKVFKA